MGALRSTQWVLRIATLPLFGRASLRLKGTSVVPLLFTGRVLSHCPSTSGHNLFTRACSFCGRSYRHNIDRGVPRPGGSQHNLSLRSTDVAPLRSGPPPLWGEATLVLKVACFTEEPFSHEVRAAAIKLGVAPTLVQLLPWRDLPPSLQHERISIPAPIGVLYRFMNLLFHSTNIGANQ